MLENHLNCCVIDAIMDGRKEEAIKEVMEVFKKTK
jgi:DNA-binding FrmR family transcriptional regulator